MDLNLDSFRASERAELQLRGLYERNGFRKYRMGRFEEYSLYQENRAFLSSEQVLTFTDLDGRLLALKPDVTLSIAKNARPAPGECKQFYYTETVVRPSAESQTFEEIRQMGLECIGAVTNESVAGVMRLAVETLNLLGEDSYLEVSHMGFITGLMEAVGVPAESRHGLVGLLRRKNRHELLAQALEAGIGQEGAVQLGRLLELSGPLGETLAKARSLVQNASMQDAVQDLAVLQNALGGQGHGIQLDLSLAGDMEYYNGLVFSGYLGGVPVPVLRGGRYDRLAGRFSAGAGALGFALYLDELERPAPLPYTARQTLNVALPKGRLGDKVLALMASIGCGAPRGYKETRRLVIENPEAGVRFFLVKPSDVAIYVEHGAADIGIVGKDILAESGADVYELLDTHLGNCRMCVAGPKGFAPDPGRPLRVATKFVNIAKRYYAEAGRDIDIIKLNGSIELAPILGLSDVIVDIVESGSTLRENELAVLETLMPISARLIANKASAKFKAEAIGRLVHALREVQP